MLLRTGLGNNLRKTSFFYIDLALSSTMGAGVKVDTTTAGHAI
jgi:hypothetical protein